MLNTSEQGPAAPGSAPAVGLDDTVVALLFANARSGEIITVTVAITLAAVQLATFGVLRAGGWLTVMLLVMLAQVALRRAYHRRAAVVGDSAF